jgi:hypothetical protein
MNDSWDIVVAGPVADFALVSTDYGEAVMSTNGRAWPVAELERSAPAFAGLPAFYKHVRKKGLDRTRLLIGDEARVGRLTRAWWHEEARQIRATLLVTSPHWLDVFSQDDERHRYGFSMDVDIRAKTVRGLSVVRTITRLYSVDLVRWPACGGHFLGAPALSEERVLEEQDDLATAIRWRVDNMNRR